MNAELVTRADDILARLRTAGWKEREGIKDELLAIATGLEGAERTKFKEYLENSRKDLSLELKWEIDEVLEAIKPPPAPPKPVEEPKVEEPPEDPNRPLTAADLKLVYDDPRGLMLYKTKKGDRWFASQADPRTGQPQTFELHPQEIAQLKTQLAGSPYWALGSGETLAR